MLNRELILSSLGAARRYLFKALAITAVSGIVSFFFAKGLLRLLLKTVHIKLFYMSFPEVFLAMVELAMYAGVFFAFPFLVWLAWYEFKGSARLTRMQGTLFVAFAILLFYSGSLFCYRIVLPSGIGFLLSYGTGHIQAMISVQRFVVFCAAMIFAFGATFEVPIVLLILSKIGILKSKTLVKTRRYAVLIITIASALITPTPDIYNMMLLAVPTYFLFEVGILLMKISEKKQRLAAERRQEASGS